MTRAQLSRDPAAIAERMTALFEKFSRPMHFEVVDRDTIYDRDGGIGG
jgi:hypothetical protein